MAKKTTQFICEGCNETHARWVGRCPNCKEYNTITEVPIASTSSSVMGFAPAGTVRTNVRLQAHSLSTRASPPPRTTTGLSEFDRTLGGGLVEAAVILIGGDPGIGKSTILLQIAANMSQGRKVVYFSGEESLDQIQLRADRLGVTQAPVDLIPSNDALAIADHVESLPAGSVCVVDSIQVMNAGLDGAPGSISQVKASAAHLIPAAKSAGVSLILVSHVTKDGSMAGPNHLKHSVDATIYIEADSGAGIYRIARAEKNRFGAVDEIGVFEMSSKGMIDVSNPSEIFISQRDPDAFGTVIFPSLEGTRPLLLEVQALVAPSAFGTGRRSVTGWDAGRLNMLLATLGARMGLSFAESDVYVNVAGGMKITDPAMDLAVASAILSAHFQVALDDNLAVFGEVGLAGEVRSSLRAESRIRECAQLGLTNIICPEIRDKGSLPGNVSCKQLKRIAQIVRALPNIEAAFAA